ncbi:hypothetical protein B0H16DRAFT_749462 [Mycena metata]|uniref:DUF6533 domain-containing protein n=1 Tax=Mycena metata TaxID=1033252 RepID=A0AAD7J104_9AGAR|nr:hypothetical protein B0H16DRAFT_749462 [Mycena metata]
MGQSNGPFRERALCLFLWDYILTFPQEVHYFWSSRWSLIKCLFFLNRYLTLVLLAFTVFFDLYPTPDTETYFEVFSALVCAFLVEVIMQIRLHAMYGHDKKLIFVISLLCIGELMTQVPNTSWTLPFCNNVIPNHFYPYWIAFMIFDTVVLLLVIRKAYHHYHVLPEQYWSNTGLMAILARDSVLYFSCNVVVFLGTTLLWRFGPQGLATVANSWSLVVPSTSAGRLLLNMRSSYRPESDHISTAGLSGLGSLHIVDCASKDPAEGGENYFDSNITTSDG